MNTITQNLSQIGSRLQQAKLIAVSKTRSVDEIEEAIKAGQFVFGENRVQEAGEKFFPLRKANPDLELHLIGALQTNKVIEAVSIFDVIQTLDRPRLADALSGAIRKTGRTPQLYVEINIGKEQQKSGIAPEHVNEFLIYCRNVCQLRISGLMCIPPINQDPRPFFEKMRSLSKQFSLQNLSMGMSGDFETAIAYGATEVRIGTALFGERPAIPSPPSL